MPRRFGSEFVAPERQGNAFFLPRHGTAMLSTPSIAIDMRYQLRLTSAKLPASASRDSASFRPHAFKAVYSSSISPLISSDRSTPPSTTVASAGNLSLPLSLCR